MHCFFLLNNGVDSYTNYSLLHLHCNDMNSFKKYILEKRVLAINRIAIKTTHEVGI